MSRLEIESVAQYSPDAEIHILKGGIKFSRRVHFQAKIRKGKQSK